MTVFSGKLYFSGRNRTGNELWEFDGINNPVQVSNIYDGIQNPAPIIMGPYQNKLYFSARDQENGRQFWVLNN